MSDKKYPVIKLEVRDKTKPPTPSNLVVYIDGVDISTVTQSLAIHCGVGEMTTVTLRMIANVETDDIMIGDGS